MSAVGSSDQYAKSEQGTVGETITDLTPGVKNIQAAYKRAGASHNHTPGYAGQLGSQEQHHRNRRAREEGKGPKEAEVCTCHPNG
jgi:hypothetical protein